MQILEGGKVKKNDIPDWRSEHVNEEEIIGEAHQDFLYMPYSTPFLLS